MRPVSRSPVRTALQMELNGYSVLFYTCVVRLMPNKSVELQCVELKLVHLKPITSYLQKIMLMVPDEFLFSVWYQTVQFALYFGNWFFKQQ